MPIRAIHHVDLAVRDVERSLAFYHDGLGWPTEGIVGERFEHGAVVWTLRWSAREPSLAVIDSLRLDSDGATRTGDSGGLAG